MNVRDTSSSVRQKLISFQKAVEINVFNVKKGDLPHHVNVPESLDWALPFPDASEDVAHGRTAVGWSKF